MSLSDRPAVLPAATPARVPGAAASPEGATPRRLGRAARAPVDAVDSGALLEGRRRIAIRHRDETYWLHETRQGKLLLTK